MPREHASIFPARKLCSHSASLSKNNDFVSHYFLNHARSASVSLPRHLWRHPLLYSKRCARNIWLGAWYMEVCNKPKIFSKPKQRALPTFFKEALGGTFAWFARYLFKSSENVPRGSGLRSLESENRGSEKKGWQCDFWCEKDFRFVAPLKESEWRAFLC